MKSVLLFLGGYIAGFVVPLIALVLFEKGMKR